MATEKEKDSMQRFEKWIARLEEQSEKLMALVETGMESVDGAPPALDAFQAGTLLTRYLTLIGRYQEWRQQFDNASDEQERLLLESILGSGASVIEARPYGDEDFDEVERQVLGRITERKSSS